MASNITFSDEEGDVPDTWEDIEICSDAPETKKDCAEKNVKHSGSLKDSVDDSDDSDDSADSDDAYEHISRDTTQDEEKNQSSLTTIQEPWDENAFSNVNNLICDIRVTYVNLMNDFVESELFIIDGDSLLIEVLSTPSLDFENGGQFLQLIYLAERFLQSFTQRGGLFEIVFFQCMESVWYGHPSMLLARQLLITHLKMNTKFSVRTIFKDWYERNWLDYLHDKRPAFIMVSDGDTKVCFGETDTSVRFMCQSLILHSIGINMNVAYPSEMKCTVTKLFGYYIESHNYNNIAISEKVKGRKTILVDVLKDVLKDRKKNECNELHSETNVKENDQLLQRVISLYLGNEDKRNDFTHSIRTVLTLAACVDVVGKKCRDSSTSDELIPVYYDLAYVYFVHAMLMSYLPLQVRAQNLSAYSSTVHSSDSSHWKTLSKFIQEIQLSIYQLLQLDAIKSLDETNSVTDIMDGRLLHRIVLQLLQDNTLQGVHQRGLQLPESISETVSSLWKLILNCIDQRDQATETQLSKSGVIDDYNQSSPSTVQDSSSSTGADFPEECIEGLIPIQCDLVERFAGDVMESVPRLNIDNDEVQRFLVSGHDFDEKYHWHSGKPLADDYDNTKDTSFLSLLPKDPASRKKQLKDKQKLARHMQRYGESLHGKLYGVQQETIIVQKNAHGQSKTKHSESKKTAAMREKNLKDKEESNKKTALSKWKYIEQGNFKSLMEDEKYDLALQDINGFISNCSSGNLPVQALFKKLECSWLAWKHQNTQKKVTKRVWQSIEGGLYYPVQIFDTVQNLLENHGNDITKQDRKTMADYILKLGFQDMAEMILNSETGKDATNTKSLDTESVDDKYAIKDMSSAHFQMEFMGHLMKRDVRSDPDPRVNTFIPDTWQRELLDAVDNNDSAVIVAPTSSGKTFASFYCMRKILKADNDGIVVYVAPTKALVNQVAAEVSARFKKDLPGGKCLYGTFTRDYRKDTLNSQILVTVPQCLEILLLSPRRQKWTDQIRYIIFDEVHCLGGEIGAEVWEHLLVTIPCPFLALSATIRNPKDLQSWLQRAQSFRKQLDEEQGIRKRLNSYEVKLVVYQERYADLKKSIYLPTGKSMEECFVPLHPVAVLSWKQFSEKGFPSDMAFSSNESLALYNLMERAWKDSANPPEQLKTLCPSRYFHNKLFITRNESRAYEQDVKKELVRWLVTPEGTLKAKQIIQLLQRKPRGEIKKHEERNKLADPEMMIGTSFMRFLQQLKEQDKLPVLVFSFNRKFCETLTYVITRLFEAKEKKIKMAYKSTERGKKAAVLQKSQQKVAKRKRDKKTNPTGPDGDDVDGNEESAVEYDDMALLDDNEVLSDCTFASMGTHTKEDLHKVMSRVRFDQSEQSIKLQRACRRGIAYHHAGLGAKWRAAIETLFRSKFLGIVVATGTLALGIHMPCKTVVFAGDSVYLDAIQYRQMSGRAGRRGFDPVGNVIFFGLPRPKIERLIVSNVPHLKGNFPISVTLVLRLMLLVSNADIRKDALGKALSLLKHPFLCQDHPEMMSQIKHYFLFSIEYLIRKGLLDTKGVPQGLAGLATHLHYHEPANFALVTFLRSGAFHRLCKRDAGEDKFSEDVMRNLVALLANLFGRSWIQAGRTIHRSSSMVILEPLSPPLLKTLDKHNREVESVFDLYIKSMAEELSIQRQPTCLPLSGIEFPSTDTTNISAHMAIHNTTETDVNLCQETTCAGDVTNSDGTYPVHDNLGSTPGKDGDVTKATGTYPVHDNLGSTPGKDGDVTNATGPYSVQDTMSGSGASERTGCNWLEAELQKTCNHYKAVSVFTALSGITDENLNVSSGDMLQCLRQGIYLEDDNIPILSHRLEDKKGRRMELNAYALDFFKHGSATTLMKENGLQSGEVYDKLKDFCMTIKAICVAMEALGPEDKDDEVVLAFKQLREEYSNKFREQYGGNWE